MPLTKEAKQAATKKFGKSDVDTGSPEVQIAMLTERITGLTEHLRTHKKDHTHGAACSRSSGAAAGS